MFEFFTALVISYQLKGHPVEVTVWYDKERHCNQALGEGYGDPLYDQLYDLYGNDMMMRCRVTDIVSYEIRPTPRPLHLEKR